MKRKETLLRSREYRKQEIEEHGSFLKKSIDFTGQDVNIEIQREVLYESKSGKIESAGVHSFTGIPIGSIQQQIEKRSHLLTLELPFLTDIVSHNRMLVESFPAATPSNCENLKKWADQHFKTGSTYDNVMRGEHIHDLFLKEWPKIATGVEFDGEKYRITSSIDAYIEDFIFDEVKEDLLSAIDKLSIAESTKKSYKSHVREMVRYCLHKHWGKHFQAGEVNWAIKSGLNTRTLASYFEYLEQRCFKEHLEDPYKDLISVRLLFYAPPLLENLDQICLKHVDQASLSIKFENITFHVPNTFIELAKTTYSKNEPFLQRNSKGLGTFIKQTSEANKMKRITPTAIRQSAQLICHQENFIPEKLPRR